MRIPGRAGGAVKVDRSGLIAAIASKYAWKVHGTAAIGELNGYWFSVSQASKGAHVYVFTSVSGLRALEATKLKSVLEDRGADLGIIEVMSSGNSIWMKLRGKGKQEEVEEIVSSSVRALAGELSYMGLKSGCNFCDSEGPLKPYMVSGTAVKMCDDCASRLAELDREGVTERKGSKGSYMTGALGAASGAVMGAILWILVARLGFVSSLVGLVMAFLAKTGYEMLNGRKGRAKAAIIAVAVFFGVVGAVFTFYPIEIREALGPDLPFSFWLQTVLIGFVNDSEVFWLIMKDLGIGLLFALLGSYGIISGILKEAGKAERGVTEII
jgi:hypothetical protein